MSFWGSLFGGSNPTLNNTIGQTGNIANFAQGTGQSNTTAGSGFFSSILSGDPSKIGQALAPAISAGQSGVQQAAKSNAEFGNRGGGTNASTQNAAAENRGNIIKAVGGAQAGAASSLLSSGQNLLSTALGAYNEQANMSQTQMENWANSILGKGISGAASAAESYALGGGASSLFSGGGGSVPEQASWHGA